MKRPSLFVAISGVLLILIIGRYCVSAVTPAPVLQITNTVAGYGTVVNLSNLDAFQSVTLAVTSPTSRVFLFQTSSDSQGKLLYDIDDVYTRSAGAYSVDVKNVKNATIAHSQFTVYTDTGSKDTSAVTLSKQIVFIGQYDFATLSVKLTDSFGNPIADHYVSVNSSRVGDIVKPYQAGISKTDARGVVAFALTSSTIGSSTYTAFDETARAAVGQPVQLMYADTGIRASSLSSVMSANLFAATGGDPVVASSSQSTGAQASLESGPVESFIFEKLPAKIQTNQPVDFTVTAHDANKKVAVGYTGTVHFTAIGGNGVFVSLPKDYVYTPSDLGTHIFPLALVFQQEGTYQLQVSDAQKITALGTITVLVKGGSAAASGQAVKVALSTPSPGSYSTNIQTLTGSAPAGKDVKLYDGDQEMGTTVTNVDGTFTYTSSPLTDGVHQLSATSIDQNGVVLGTSDKIAITIDTQPPAIGSVVLTPSFDVTTGLPVQVELQSEEKLKKALLDVGGVVTELTEDLEKAGVYHGTFAAADKDGEYPLKFTLDDALGNESVLTYGSKLTVHMAGQVKAVKNLKAFPESFRVTLQWVAPDNGLSNVDHYRVYYGTSPANLTQKVDTSSPALSWYIPNLKNGTQYYFGVVAVDKQGSLGEAGTLALATPSENASLNGLPVADSYISSAGRLPGQTGPEVLWLFPLSYGTYRVIRRNWKKRK